MYLAGNNGVNNSPIERRDAEVAGDMLGPSKFTPKVKETRSKAEALNENLQMVDVHRKIQQYCNSIESSEDVMCIDDVPFLTSLSESIYYGTIGALDNLKYRSLENEIKRMLREHAIWGFRVVAIGVDLQLKSIKDLDLVGAPVNVVSREEHVKKIERFHLLIKEW